MGAKPIGRGPRVQQDFARGFGGPQSTAMPAAENATIVGAPGSATNPHPGASVTFTAKGRNNIPDRQVTGTSLGNGLAFVARNNPVVGTPEFSVYHIRHGIVMASIGAAGRDESRTKYAFQRHFAGLNANQTVEQMRADPGWIDKAQNLRPVIDATNTDVHRAQDEARAAAGRERRVEAVMSGDRGQRTGAVVGGREGRWLTIQGKKKHIPRAADWSHDAGSRVRFDSPAGTTDVYRTGPEGTRELVSQPGQRGTHADVRQLPFRRGGAPPAPPVAPAAPHVDPASSAKIAARQAALSAMTPGEHRMIDGVYVSRNAKGDFAVHHGWGSPLYRDRGISGASDENLAASANGPHTVVLDSLHGAAEAAKSAPNINMTPMTTAHQMESRLKKGDKVAARYLSGGEHHGGNATVERVNQASIAVKMVDGPHAGRVVSVPRYQPFKPNSRWTVNNRVEPRNAKIDQHVSRVASTPISGGRLLQKVGNDTGRLSNAPRQQDGRLMYLVDGQGPYTPQEALQLLGLPASGATPAEYEAWRRSQGLREADFSAGQRRKLAKQGKAMPHGGFPIRDLADLKNAIQALGRAKDKAAAQRHIIKRAHKLGLVSALPTDWNVREAEMDARELRVMIEMLASDPALIALAEAHDKGAEPFSTSKTSNWVAKAGGLPHYIQHIAHDLMEKRGMDESRAIAMAVGIVKRWARGGGKVKPDTRAAAAKAVAEWEAKKAKAHAA